MIKLFSRTKEVTLICSSILLLAFFGMYNTKLAGMLGISFYTAKRIVDIVSTAGSIYSVIGLVAVVAGTGGVGIGILFTAKALLKKYSRQWVASW